MRALNVGFFVQVRRILEKALHAGLFENPPTVRTTIYNFPVAIFSETAARIHYQERARVNRAASRSRDAQLSKPLGPKS